MSQKHKRWLQQELTELVKLEVLDEAAATRLRSHYESRSEESGRLRELFFVVLGVVLVGGGVILLLAHNWSELGRPARTVLSFAPLVLMQALAGWGLLKRRTGMAWREGVATGWTLSVAACIALIGQTYHLPPDASGFVLVWMLLILPVIYLLNAALPVCIYLVGITSWAFIDPQLSRTSVGAWILLLLVAPLVVREVRGFRGGRAALVGWAFAATFPILVGGTFLARSGDLWIPVLGLAFAWLWLEGESRREEAVPWLRSPLSVVGGMGVLVQLLSLSFRGSWEGLGHRSQPFPSWDVPWPLYGVAAAFVGRWAWLALAAYKRRDRPRLVLGAWPVVALPLTLLGLSLMGEWGLGLSLAVNVFLAAVGLVWMLAGLWQGRVGLANTGLGVLALVILVRFFDSDLPLQDRGLAFVVIGLGFLVANRFLQRRLHAAGGGS